MDSPKKQITDRLKQANNVLVTVRANPSVDQLAAAIGLTLLLNRLGKHATAVFSGQIPNTIEFLQPEKTLEKNTDSLRDFIIALDKSKADKLRYKVEDQMVKIFITPYRTSISDKDLEFSQGDFNVDVVMALGVNEQKDLDQAITSHGRILHDATVVSVNTQDGASLGSINWVQPDASSLCEMLLDVGLSLKADVLDGQMATAFLAGIVAETNRFSNEKTSSVTMQLSAKLIAAGANQQLVASQLQPAVAEKPAALAGEEDDAELPEVTQSEQAAAPAEMVETKSEEPDDGSLEIDHGNKKPLIDLNALPDSEEPEENPLEQIDIDKEGILKRAKDIEAMKQKVVEPLPAEKENSAGSRLITQPPTLGGTLTANSTPEGLDPSTDPLGANSTQGPLLSHETSATTQKTSATSGIQPIPEDSEPASSPPPTAVPAPNQPPSTLSDLEKVVGSPHLTQSLEQPAPTNQTDSGVSDARSAVMQAVSGIPPQVLEPVQSLNSFPMDLNKSSVPAPVAPSLNPVPDNISPAGLVLPGSGLPADSTAASVTNATAPPPVPPPLIPPVMPPPSGSNTPGPAPL